MPPRRSSRVQQPVFFRFVFPPTTVSPRPKSLSWSVSGHQRSRAGPLLDAYCDLYRDEHSVEDDEECAGAPACTISLREQDERSHRHPEEPRKAEDVEAGEGSEAPERRRDRDAG